MLPIEVVGMRDWRAASSRGVQCPGLPPIPELLRQARRPRASRLQLASDRSGPGGDPGGHRAFGSKGVLGPKLPANVTIVGRHLGRSLPGMEWGLLTHFRAKPRLPEASPAAFEEVRVFLWLLLLLGWSLLEMQLRVPRLCPGVGSVPKGVLESRHI